MIEHSLENSGWVCVCWIWQHAVTLSRTRKAFNSRPETVQLQLIVHFLATLLLLPLPFAFISVLIFPPFVANS